MYSLKKREKKYQILIHKIDICFQDTKEIFKKKLKKKKIKKKI